MLVMVAVVGAAVVCIMVTVALSSLLDISIDRSSGSWPVAMVVAATGSEARDFGAATGSLSPGNKTGLAPMRGTSGGGRSRMIVGFGVVVVVVVVVDVVEVVVVVVVVVEVDVVVDDGCCC